MRPAGDPTDKAQETGSARRRTGGDGEHPEAQTPAPGTADGSRPPADTDHLTRSAGRGALWRVFGGGWKTVVRLGASMVLARALFPEDFGILGMAVLVRGLIERIGLVGMTAAVIAQRDTSEDDLCTCFWSMTVVRVVLGAIAFAGAPLAAMFFDTPQVTWVLRALSLTFLTGILSMIPSTLLLKELRFRTPVLIQCGQALVESGMAVGLVLLTTLDYWSLVLAMLAGAVFHDTSLLLTRPWRPRLRFSRSSFRRLFFFGMHTLGRGIANYFHQNIDYLLVGRILGRSALGFYEFAYRIPHLVYNRVAQPASRVVFPTLSHVQDSDRQMAAGYFKAARYLALIAFPALGGLAVLAQPAVLALWGSKWLSITVPLQILCLSAAIRTVALPAGAIFLCKQRPDVMFKFTLATLPVTFGLVGVLGYYYNVVGVAAGMALSSLPSLVLVWMALRMVSTPMRRLAERMAGPLGATGVCCGCALGASIGLEYLGAGVWPRFGCGVLAGGSAYLAAMRLLFPGVLADVRQTVATVAHRERKDQTG